MIGMIVATNRDFVIGRTSGEIPWKHKGDQKLFKELTTDATVIMGRVTWESIPAKFRPLPNRINVVITTTKVGEIHDPPCVEAYDSLEKALVAREHDENIWLIGGARIYEAGIALCDRFHVTLVPDAVTGDDLVYLPENCRDLSDRLVRTRYTHPNNNDLWVADYRRPTVDEGVDDGAVQVHNLQG